VFDKREQQPKGLAVQHKLKISSTIVMMQTTRGRPFIKRGRSANKRPIIALVERGNVRRFHAPVADQATVQTIFHGEIKP